MILTGRACSHKNSIIIAGNGAAYDRQRLVEIALGTRPKLPLMEVAWGGSWRIAGNVLTSARARPS